MKYAGYYVEHVPRILALHKSGLNFAEIGRVLFRDGVRMQFGSIIGDEAGGLASMVRHVISRESSPDIKRYRIHTDGDWTPERQAMEMAYERQAGR